MGSALIRKRIGYCCARVGFPLIAAEPRIVAAVLGLADGPIALAPLVAAPVLFYVQSDDDPFPGCLRALFDALGSSDKAWSGTPVVTWICRGHRLRNRLSD
ncbi:hypothetical protein [Paenarthrobacter sp. PH39-S1]|uniref:hypothetical protein n=1 Tax=Paenarthrobacter sp. PH39-S1 TaxID=3046204 RepID=UPI0024B9362A|nr:hypothetical protein [Paenarthrobacter sp. PH39-S1]MDJ0356708.1 hypothetical protein [Paenarthrobacter sp. PH39-S1]